MRLSLVRLQASDLSSCWFSSILRITAYPFPLKTIDLSECLFVKAFDTFIDDLAAAPSHIEEFVRVACSRLCECLNQIYFLTCNIDVNARLVETTFDQVIVEDTLKNCVVTGKPDISFLWYNHGIHIWELKNQNYNLTLNTHEFHMACAQLVIYMKADMESMFRSFNLIPEQSAGVLTNGKDWLLVMCMCSVDKDGKLSLRWFHTIPICYDWHCSRDHIQKQNVINLIHTACLISKVTLDILMSNPLGVSFSNLKIKDEDNYDGDGASGNKRGAKSGQKGADNQTSCKSDHGNFRSGGIGGKNKGGSGGKYSRRPLTIIPLSAHNLNKVNTTREDATFVTMENLPPLLRQAVMSKSVITVTSSELFEC